MASLPLSVTTTIEPKWKAFMKTCLIVDDSKVIRKVARHILETLSEPVAVRAAMSAGWERVSKGVVETEQGPLLLVDVAGLIAGPGAEMRAA